MFPGFASAQTTNIDAIWARSSQMNQCKVWQEEVQTWFPKDPLKPIEIPKDKFERAFQILSEIKFPTAEDLVQIRAAFKADFATTYFKYLGVAGADCPQVRVSIGKALVNSAKTDSSIRVRSETALKKILTSTLYENLLDQGVGSFVLNYGLTNGLWNSSPKLLREAKGLLEEHKQNVEAFMKDRARFYAGSLSSKSDSSPESAETLKADPNFEQIKAATFEELQLAQKFSTRLRALVSQLGK